MPSIIGSEEWFEDKFAQEEKTIVEGKIQKQENINTVKIIIKTWIIIIEEILSADSESLKYQKKEEKEDRVSLRIFILVYLKISKFIS